MTFKTISLSFAAFAACLCFTAVDTFAQGTASPYSAKSAPIATDRMEAGQPGDYFAPTDFLLDSSGQNFYVASEGYSQLRRVPADGSAPQESLQLSFKPFKLRTLVEMDPTSGEKLRTWPVGREPFCLDLTPDGRLAIVEVAAKTDSGALDPVPLRLVAEFPVGRSPADVAVKVDADGSEKVYIADRFGGTLVEMDPTSGEKLRTWPNARRNGSDVGRKAADVARGARTVLFRPNARRQARRRRRPPYGDGGK